MTGEISKGVESLHLSVDVQDQIGPPIMKLTEPAYFGKMEFEEEILTEVRDETSIFVSWTNCAENVQSELRLASSKFQ